MAKKQLDVNFNQSFLQTVVNKVILKFRIPTTVNGRFNNLTFNILTGLTRLITFFILTLLHNVNKIVMYSLLYIDLLSLRLKNTLVSVGPRTEKLITVSNDHGRTHKCNFSFFYWKYLFRANLVKKKQKKIKTVSLSWNLVPRLIQICRIQWCCSLFPFLTRFWPFLGKLPTKNQNCQFKVKFGT